MRSHHERFSRLGDLALGIARQYHHAKLFTVDLSRAESRIQTQTHPDGQVFENGLDKLACAAKIFCGLRNVMTAYFSPLR
jgi:hypothetical protein